jgi:hypothetical protein
LADVVASGYWHARSLEFFEKHTYMEWSRLPGDLLFIASVVPLVYLTTNAGFRPSTSIAPPDSRGTVFEGPLFTQVIETPEQDRRGLRL